MHNIVTLHHIVYTKRFSPSYIGQTNALTCTKVVFVFKFYLEIKAMWKYIT